MFSVSMVHAVGGIGLRSSCAPVGQRRVIRDLELLICTSRAPIGYVEHPFISMVPAHRFSCWRSGCAVWRKDGRVTAPALEHREHPHVYHRPLFQVVETLTRARTRETLWPQEMTISGGPMPKRRERALTIRVSGFLGRGDREKWSALRFA
jgi:hypothetical protein